MAFFLLWVRNRIGRTQAPLLTGGQHDFYASPFGITFDVSPAWDFVGKLLGNSESSASLMAAR